MAINPGFIILLSPVAIFPKMDIHRGKRGLSVRSVSHKAELAHNAREHMTRIRLRQPHPVARQFQYGAERKKSQAWLDSLYFFDYLSLSSPRQERQCQKFSMSTNSYFFREQ